MRSNNRLVAVATVAVLSVVLVACGGGGGNADPEFTGRWELVDDTYSPFEVAAQMQFYEDGTGRMYSELFPGGSQPFTWSAQDGGIALTSAGVMQIYDYELSLDALTIIFDRANNFHAVYRRVSG